MVGGYETEEEQIEAIRRWWHENGRAVIAGIVVAVLGVVGWQQWQSYQQSQSLAAAEAYQGVLTALNDNELEAAREQADKLRSEHAGSVQALLADLRLGAAAVEADDYETAEAALRHAADGDGHDPLRRLAILRLAGVLDAQGKREAALERLEPVPDGAAAARYHELIGDIQAARNEREAAVEAYRAAIDADPRARRRGLIQLKLTDLGADLESRS
jgi:predicted negative regulator of RcsB-dependent stress response